MIVSRYRRRGRVNISRSCRERLHQPLGRVLKSTLNCCLRALPVSHNAVCPPERSSMVLRPAIAAQRACRAQTAGTPRYIAKLNCLRWHARCTSTQASELGYTHHKSPCFQHSVIRLDTRIYSQPACVCRCFKAAVGVAEPCMCCEPGSTTATQSARARKASNCAFLYGTCLSCTCAEGLLTACRNLAFHCTVLCTPMAVGVYGGVAYITAGSGNSGTFVPQ